jgi:hypothetical protein
VNVLEYLNFHTLASWRRHLDALLLVNVYADFKFCPSLLESVGIHVPVRKFRDFPLFTVGSSHKVVPLLDLHQPQIPFAKILIYLINNCLHLIIF